APVGATAKCGDGTYSKAKTKQGACSKHKGGAEWLAGGAAAAAPTGETPSIPRRNRLVQRRHLLEEPAPFGDLLAPRWSKGAVEASTKLISAGKARSRFNRAFSCACPYSPSA